MGGVAAKLGWWFVKLLVTALIVVGVSEAAKRSDRLGGFIAALPLVTVLALIWLHLEGQPTQKLVDHARYTLWYVVPTLPMFVVFPIILPRIGFWPSLLIGIGICVACLRLTQLIARSMFGVPL
jgi:F0F1-type ATP synthase assembly protein I